MAVGDTRRGVLVNAAPATDTDHHAQSHQRKGHRVHFEIPPLPACPAPERAATDRPWRFRQ